MVVIKTLVLVSRSNSNNRTGLRVSHTKYPNNPISCKQWCSRYTELSGNKAKISHAECISDDNISKRHYVKDRKSGQFFLVDSGAVIFLAPAISKSNKTSIDHIDLNLRRTFVWNFCIADAPYPILAADFFFFITDYWLIFEIVV